MRDQLDVCIVDDDEFYNKLVTASVQNIARKKAFTVKTQSFKTGQECLELIRNSTDLVLLDFYLSKTNDITQTGIDILKALKKKHPATDVVFISQEHEWEKFRNELVADGALDFIKKDDQLNKNLESLLAKTLAK